MIRLMLTEFSRLRHRRAVMLLLLAALLIPLVMAATTLWSSRPVSQADLDQARIDSGVMTKEQITWCQDSPRDSGINPKGLSEQEILAYCTAEMERQADEQAQYLVRAPLNLAELSSPGQTALGVVTIVAALVFIAGATFAGSDWASGSMSNQLLMEPRRGRVWLAKATMVAVVSAVWSAVVLSLFWAILLVMAKVWDRPEVPGMIGHLVNLNLRGVALVAGSAVIGFAVSMLFRSTMSAVGIVFLLSLGSSILIMALPIDDPERWLPSSQLAAWVDNGYQYWPTFCYDMCEQGEVIGFWHAALYLGVLGVVIIAASLRSFSRRDV